MRSVRIDSGFSKLPLSGIMFGPLRVGQILGMLICMALPHGSLENKQNCTTGDLPVFSYSAVASGYSSMLPEVPHGTAIEYECYPDYSLKPGRNTTIVCMDGKWIPTEDPCIRIKRNCSTRNLPVFSYSVDVLGYSKNVTEVPHGTPIEYECKPGSSLKPGRDTTIFCLDGAWAPTEDPCTSIQIKQNCSTGDLPVFSYSAVASKYPNILIEVPHGTPIEYECKPGSSLKPGGNTTIVCVDGAWTPTRDPCTSAEITLQGCSAGDLPVFMNSAPAQGRNSSATVPHDTSVVYKCNDGSFKNPDRDSTIVCLDGFWIPSEDPCDRYEIIAGMNPTNVTCEEKNKLPQEWSEATEFCKGGCAISDLPTFEYSVVDNASLSDVVPSNTHVGYRCKVGSEQKPGGKSSVVCVQGSWQHHGDSCHSPSATTSVPVTNATGHGVLIIPHGIIVKGKKQKYSPGDRVTVECIPGYVLHGNPVIRYSGGNEWSPKIPSCSLSIFISIFVAAIALGAVVLIFLVAYRNFTPQESSGNITLVRYYR